MGKTIAIDSDALDDELKLALTLGKLYFENGFERNRIAKFERYDLYREHRDFLVCGNVISFSDTDGSLLALKPDVTLSIISGYDDSRFKLNKVFYDEDVFRVSGWTGKFKCCRQVGLECFGKVGKRDFTEVMRLALDSLEMLDDDCIMVLSDMDVVMKALAAFRLNDSDGNIAIDLIRSKNFDDLKLLLAKGGQVNGLLVSNFLSLLDIVGSPSSENLDEIHRLCDELGASREFEAFKSVLECECISNRRDKVQIDFSLIGDTGYYGGLYFNGFLKGSGEAVLSGGEYYKLLKKMGKKGKAIGFAVFLDRIGNLKRRAEQC